MRPSPRRAPADHDEYERCSDLLAPTQRSAPSDWMEGMALASRPSHDEERKISGHIGAQQHYLSILVCLNVGMCTYSCAIHSILWKDLKCVVVVVVVVRRPSSVPIEFPRKCISVNPRNWTNEFPCKCISVNPRKSVVFTYEFPHKSISVNPPNFPRRCLSVNPRKCIFSEKSTIIFYPCIQ